MANSIKEAEDYILNIPKFATKHTMEETKEFLDEIGDFSKKIPTIHVAGTNGKGSVCAYLREVFLAADIVPAVFTSPHLIDIRERFEIGNEMISEADFLEAFEFVLRKTEEEKWKKKNYHPSYFEFLFFMAAFWFGKINPGVIILETGLGGRLDATNAISSPAVCVITEIGLDHTEYLGNTVEEIAGEKAGIIKTGVPVVYVDKTGSGEIIRNRAAEKHSESMAISENTINNLQVTPKGIDFCLFSVYHKTVKLSVKTKALYQAENGALAFYALEFLNSKIFDISATHIQKGFLNMKWPGRMEEVLPGIVVDGAHNEDGTRAFLASVSKDNATKRRLVYSAVSDKNIEKITEMILASGLFSHFYVAPLNGSRAAEIGRLKECFTSSNAKFFDTPKEAFDKMRSELVSTEKGYVAGSLYLVGEIKELL